MKTLKSIGILVLLALVIMAAGSKWLWENRSATITPTLAEINMVAGLKSNIQDQTDSIKNVLTDVVKLSDAIDPALTFAKISYVDSARSILYAGLKRIGATIKTLPFAASLVDLTITNSTLNDAQCNIALIDVFEEVTVSSAHWIQQTQGDYTGDAYNGIAIYEYDLATTTWTKITETTNDADIWKQAASTHGSKALATPVTLYPDHIYYSAVMYNNSAQVTAPKIYSCGPVSALSSFYSVTRITGTLNTQTAFPATITSLTAGGNAMWTIWFE